jgi:PAS domain S-box-containing protein
MADAPRDAVDQWGLEALLGQLDDAVEFVDRDGAILLTNRAEEPPAARATPQMADLGQALETFHPDGRRYETAEWPVLRSIRTGEAVTGEEFYRLARDGSRRSFSCNSAPIHDENGRLTGAVLVTRDVSGPKHAQEQLAYLLPMLDQTEDAIIAFDPLWRVTAWNQGAERMYGWSAEEALRRELRSFMTLSMSDAQHAETRREIAERGRWRGEVDVERRDGSMVSVESIHVAIRDVDSQITGYLAIQRDVTERKGTAARLVSAAREQTLLTDLSLRALSADDLQALLDDAVRLVADVLQVELGEIAELEPAGGRLSWRAAFGWSADEIARAGPCPAGAGSLVGYAFLVGEPVISDNVAADERFRVSSLLAQRAPMSAAAVVIPGQHDPYGVLAVIARQPRTFGSREIEFMQAVATVIAIAVERAAVDDRLEAARLSERARIARELHDGGLRELTDALSIATLARSGAADPLDKERWAELITSLAGLGRQLRGAIYDLRLGTHEDRLFPGLLGELVEVQAAMAVDCRVELAEHELLPAGSLGDRGTELLWIVREAITNARLHSGATLIRVDASGSTGQLLRLVIRDDGRWPDRESVLSSRPGAGITGMLERADLVGSTLTFASGAPAGTEVSLESALPGSQTGPG